MTQYPLRVIVNTLTPGSICKNIKWETIYEIYASRKIRQRNVHGKLSSWVNVTSKSDKK